MGGKREIVAGRVGVAGGSDAEVISHNLRDAD